VVNRAKLRVDTFGREESKLTKKKTGTVKISVYSISSGVRGKSSDNYFETDDTIT
jgi:hypothetical protein